MSKSFNPSSVVCLRMTKIEHLVLKNIIKSPTLSIQTHVTGHLRLTTWLENLCHVCYGEMVFESVPTLKSRTFFGVHLLEVRIQTSFLIFICKKNLFVLYFASLQEFDENLFSYYFQYFRIETSVELPNKVLKKYRFLAVSCLVNQEASQRGNL